jgi:hypothetical protein
MTIGLLRRGDVSLGRNAPNGFGCRPAKVPTNTWAGSCHKQTLVDRLRSWNAADPSIYILGLLLDGYCRRRDVGFWVRQRLNQRFGRSIRAKDQKERTARCRQPIRRFIPARTVCLQVDRQGAIYVLFHIRVVASKDVPIDRIGDRIRVRRVKHPQCPKS